MLNQRRTQVCRYPRSLRHRLRPHGNFFDLFVMDSFTRCPLACPLAAGEAATVLGIMREHIVNDLRGRPLFQRQRKQVGYSQQRLDRTINEHFAVECSHPVGPARCHCREQLFLGEPPDCRVDIFSCGVLFYELLTGTPPFRGSSSQRMYQVLHDTPPGPSTLAIDRPPPERFNAIVARALARRPEDRYASAAQMRAALLEVAGRPIAPHVSVATMIAPRPSAEEAPTVLLPRGVPSVPVKVVTAPAPTIASEPASPSTLTTPASPKPVWDDALLGAIEALLVDHLGPVARLVVRDTARRSADAHALVTRVASEALEADERDAFLAKAQALLPARSTPPAPAEPPDASTLPVLGSTPMAESVTEKARLLLTQHIGPIAGVIVRRAAARATSRETFFAELVDQAGDDTDPKLLLAQLWRIE